VRCFSRRHIRDHPACYASRVGSVGSVVNVKLLLIKHKCVLRILMDFLHHSNHFYVESSNMLFIIFTMTSIDEDIAMLDTSTPSFFPSCNSSPTQLPRHSRIQQTRRLCFDHNFFVQHRNGVTLDSLERGRRRCRFGSGLSSRSPMD
jgi:hypothetical protein